MLPPGLFRIRTFAVANAVTLVVYGALGATFFLLVVQVQVNLGYGAAASGAAGIPVTIVLALLSARVGSLVAVVGPRRLLVAGPTVMAVALVWLSQAQAGTSLWLGVLPAMTVFALGLVLVVAPVTTTALVDVDPARAGVASGVNNAVARIASLLAIAVLPLAGQLGGAEAGSDAAFSGAMRAAAVLCVLGAVVAGVFLPSGGDPALSSPARAGRRNLPFCQVRREQPGRLSARQQRPGLDRARDRLPGLGVDLPRHRDPHRDAAAADRLGEQAASWPPWCSPRSSPSAEGGRRWLSPGDSSPRPGSSGSCCSPWASAA